MKLFKKGERSLTINEAVDEALPVKPEKIMDSLDALSALEGMKKGEEGSIQDFLSAIEKLRK